ncbi:MAG: ATP-dependent Clp protease adaptor ClpS [Saprospiraceae bacterium]|nr:ATP-dependent Clp protease adaptor ClpS [Saprospiraceae bacterium]
MPANKPFWEEDEETLVMDEEDIDAGSTSPAKIIVYNDDHNTFEWVIESFMEVLRHTSEQAEQLAIIIHNNGKATVKSGAKNELIPLCQALLDRDLTAEIDDE